MVHGHSRMLAHQHSQTRQRGACRSHQARMAAKKSSRITRELAYALWINTAVHNEPPEALLT